MNSLDAVSHADSEADKVSANGEEQSRRHPEAHALIDKYCGGVHFVDVAYLAVSDALRQRDEYVTSTVVTDTSDREDEYSELIRDAHPTITHDHDTYRIAMQMVGNRYSKGALVNLVNWLLSERKWLYKFRDDCAAGSSEMHRALIDQRSINQALLPALKGVLEHFDPLATPGTDKNVAAVRKAEEAIAMASQSSEAR